MANRFICSKLQQARKDAGLSQKEVYEWLGVSQSTFSSWETGKSEPALPIFIRLCLKYEIDDIPEYFLSEKSVPRRRVLDSAMLNKLALLSDNGRAAVYNCLEFEYNNMKRARNASKRIIPVYLQPAAAGLGNYLGDADYEEAELEAPPDADAGIRISGDSMEPVISDGDIAFIKFQPQILGDQTGIFVLNGEAFCKRLEYRAGDVYLCSFNPKYSPIRIRSTDDLRVIGRILL